MLIRSRLMRNKTDIIIYFLYICAIVFFLFPIVCVLSLSLKSATEIFTDTSIIPKKPTLDNYKFVFENTRMLAYIKNSFILVIYTVVGTLAVAALSAYGLSRFNFKNKNFLIILILMFQMISAVVICIPLFRFLAQLGLLNNLWVLGFVYVATQVPFATYLLKGVFDSIPKEMDESAAIDGASRLKILIQIILPCARSGISSAVIFLSINAWSSFLIPFILLNRDKLYPVSVGILSVQGTYQDITIQYLAAASVVGLLPAILLVVFLQRFIISAMMSGAVKG